MGQCGYVLEHFIQTLQLLRCTVNVCALTSRPWPMNQNESSLVGVAAQNEGKQGFRVILTRVDVHKASLHRRQQTAVGRHNVRRTCSRRSVIDSKSYANRGT